MVTLCFWMTTLKHDLPEPNKAVAAYNPLGLWISSLLAGVNNFISEIIKVNENISHQTHEIIKLTKCKMTLL